MSEKTGSLRSLITINRDVPAWPFIVLGLALLVLGLVGVGQVLLQGHEAVYAVNREVPWGLLIATYAYFVIISTGLAFIGGLGHAFGFEKYARIHKRIVVLAFVVLLAGFTQIGMEIGHPFRLMYIFLLSPHFSAPILWMGLFYTIELAILAAELYLLFRPGKPASPRLVAGLGLAALLVGVVATSNLGYVFGSINARPFYHGLFFPAFLVISGIGGGAALLLVIYQIVFKFNIPGTLRDTMQGLGRLMGLCIAGMIFLYFWKIMSSVYTEPQGAFEAAAALLSGPLAAEFWIGEVVLAMALPLALILLSRGASVGMLGLAGLIHLVGLFFTRYDYIVAGQLPVMREGYPGSGVHTVNGLAQYAPSAGEWLIFALGLGVFLVLYFAAEKFLDMATPAHH